MGNSAEIEVGEEMRTRPIGKGHGTRSCGKKRIKDNIRGGELGRGGSYLPPSKKGMETAGMIPRLKNAGLLQ